MNTVNTGAVTVTDLTIAIVDDDKADRLLAKRWMCKTSTDLSFLEFETTTALFDTLEEVSQEPLDMILLDINLPPTSGLAALKKLKSNPNWSDIPVVMYTTSNRLEDEEISKGDGARDYLVKPATREETERCVEKLGGILNALRS